MSVDTFQKAAELSKLYLHDDTESRREMFIQVYLQAQTLPHPASDMDILRAYFLFDGDANRAVEYLKAFLALRELGFPEDQISSALLLCKNKQEEALEHLMKNN